MALTLGTNCGFVTVAPTTDPAGVNNVVDGQAFSIRHTSPATAAKIIEVGWYADGATEEANFEVGLYTDDGGADPNAQLFASATNAKGTGAGWKSVVVDWDIDPDTIYWICAQLDDTATATNGNLSLSGGAGIAFKAGATLPSPWGLGSTTDTDGMFAIYAVWEAAEGGGAGGALRIILAQ